MDSPSELERIREVIQEGEKILDSGREVYIQEHVKIDKTQFFSWRTRASSLLSVNFSDHDLTRHFKDAVKVGPGPLTAYPLRKALNVLRRLEDRLQNQSDSSGE